MVQWLPLVASIMALWSAFSEIAADVLKLAEHTGLSLPLLVPHLTYKLLPKDLLSLPTSPFFFFHLQLCVPGGAA